MRDVILDIGDVAAGYAGRLFADRGADVIKVERPGGDEIRQQSPCIEIDGEFVGATFVYINVNKRFVTLDWSQPVGWSLLRSMAARADVLLVDDPDLDVASLLEAGASGASGPVAITVSGFGRTGPHRDFASGDLVDLAAGGVLELIGNSDGPMRLPGHMTDFIVGAVAAANAQMLLLERAQTGRSRVLDLSRQEAIASLTTLTGVARFVAEGVKGRTARENRGVPGGFFATQDGHVELSVTRSWIWPVLADWIHEVTGEEGVLNPSYRGPTSARMEHKDLIHYWVSELTQRFTSDELMAEAQRRRVPVAAVQTMSDLYVSPQLESREYFTEPSWLPGGVMFPGPALRGLTASAPPKPPGRPGRDNAEVYREMTELNDAALSELQRDSVI